MASGDWSAFKDCLLGQFRAKRGPFTAGQLRRTRRGGPVRPLADYTNAVEELVSEGRVSRLKASPGQRATRYEIAASTPAGQSPKATDRPVVRGLASPPVLPVPPPTAPRVAASRADVVPALVSRMVQLDADFARGGWLPVAWVVARTTDLFRTGRECEGALTNAPHRFACQMRNGRPVFVSLRPDT
jgi:hypothetical protein